MAARNRTTFYTMQVATNLERGQEIGIGKCVAVQLRLNNYLLNDTGPTPNGVEFMYFGDRNTQNFELTRGNTSHRIECKDLSEVYVRTPFNNDIGNENFLQVTVFHEDEPDIYEQ